MNTATQVSTPTGFNGDARLYKVAPPMEYGDGLTTEFVIVSASNVPWSGPETYIFPADDEGKILNWGELEGSFKGELNHETALEYAGYEVSP